MTSSTALQRAGARSDDAQARPLEDALKSVVGSRECVSSVAVDWDALQARCVSQLSRKSLADVARRLGVSVDALERLGMGLHTYAVTFPMRGADGRITGMRKRTFKDLTDKHSFKDSHLGLFIPTGTIPAKVALICEGETDTGAALTLGFEAIGRPSATSYVQETVSFFSDCPVACPCIVVDNDDEGESGAEDLSEAMLAAMIPHRILTMPEDSIGDLREWLTIGGLTREALRKAINAEHVMYPDRWPRWFSQVPHALSRNGWIARVGPSATMVLLAIASYSDSHHVCRVSRARLAELTALSIGQIDRCNGKLKKLGLLDWKRGGTNRVNEYRVNFGPCAGARRRAGRAGKEVAKGAKG